MTFFHRILEITKYTKKNVHLHYSFSKIPGFVICLPKLCLVYKGNSSKPLFNSHTLYID